MEVDLEYREPRSGYMGQSQYLLSFSTIGSLVSYPHLSLPKSLASISALTQHRHMQNAVVSRCVLGQGPSSAAFYYQHLCVQGGLSSPTAMGQTLVTSH